MVEPAIRRRRTSGERSHQAILETAMRLASVAGINGLTIGRLADDLAISKSGLYAHFDSKLDLQIQTIRAAATVFEREVVGPAMAAPSPLERITRFCEAYLSYVEREVFPGGCFFAGLVAEVDADPGPLRDEIAGILRSVTGLVEGWAHQAQEAGQIRSDVNVAQLVFELNAPIDLANYYRFLFDDPGYLDRARRAIGETVARAKPG